MLIVRFLAPVNSLAPVASAFPAFWDMVVAQPQSVEISLSKDVLEVAFPPGVTALLQ